MHQLLTINTEKLVIHDPKPQFFNIHFDVFLLRLIYLEAAGTNILTVKDG